MLVIPWFRSWRKVLARQLKTLMPFDNVLLVKGQLSMPCNATKKLGETEPHWCKQCRWRMQPLFTFQMEISNENAMSSSISLPKPDRVSQRTSIGSITQEMI